MIPNPNLHRWGVCSACTASVCADTTCSEYGIHHPELPATGRVVETLNPTNPTDDTAKCTVPGCDELPEDHYHPADGRRDVIGAVRQFVRNDPQGGTRERVLSFLDSLERGHAGPHYFGTPRAHPR